MVSRTVEYVYGHNDDSLISTIFIILDELGTRASRNDVPGDGSIESERGSSTGWVKLRSAAGRGRTQGRGLVLIHVP